jgi:hypothetical protein
MSSKLGPVRPPFNLPDRPQHCQRHIAGTKNHGIIVDSTEEGILLNAFYSGFSDPDKKYAVLREPVIIPWEEIDKIKKRALNPRNLKAVIDRTEDDVDEEYLKTLPIVTINHNRYYIDPDLRERRAVNKPKEVWRF